MTESSTVIIPLLIFTRLPFSEIMVNLAEFCLRRHLAYYRLKSPISRDNLNVNYFVGNKRKLKLKPFLKKKSIWIFLHPNPLYCLLFCRSENNRRCRHRVCEESPRCDHPDCLLIVRVCLAGTPDLHGSLDTKVHQKLSHETCRRAHWPKHPQHQ